MQQDISTIGRRIKELRLSKRLTQDELADQLGITAQAVSKWETGITMPDIGMLLPLSKILQVGVDELLGGRRLQEFEEKFQKYVPLGSKLTLLVSEEALREFPENKTFLYRRACDEYFIGKESEGHVRETYLHRAVLHFDKLLQLDPDFNAARGMLAEAYREMGNKDMALKEVYKCSDCDELLRFYLEGEELIEYKQKKLLKKFNELCSALLSFGTDEAIALHKQLVEQIYKDDVKYYNTDLASDFAKIKESLKNGHMEDYQNQLWNTYEKAIAYDNIPDEEIPYTTPFFDRLCYDNRGTPKHMQLGNFLYEGLRDNLFSEESAKPLRDHILNTHLTFQPLNWGSKNTFISFFHRDAYANDNNMLYYGTAYDLPDKETEDFFKKATKTQRYPYHHESQIRDFLITAAIRLIENGILTGALAFIGNRTVGFCNFGDKEKYLCLGLPDDNGQIQTAPEDSRIMAITEVVTADDFKKWGLAEKMIDNAVSRAKKQQYDYIEAYPLKRMLYPADRYEALVDTYLRLGFSVIRDLTSKENGPQVILQKKLK